MTHLANQQLAGFSMDDCGQPDYELTAVSLIGQGRQEEALEVYRCRIKEFPEDRLPHWRLAVELQKLGDLNEAERECRIAIAIMPSFASARLTLGNILFSQGRLHESLAEFEAVLCLEPKYDAAALAIARIYRDQGRVDEAALLLRKLTNGQSPLMEAFFELGELHVRAGQGMDAVAVLRKCTAHFPRCRRAYLELGNLLARLGKDDEAQAAWQQVLQVQSRDRAQGHSLPESETKIVEAARDALRGARRGNG